MSDYSQRMSTLEETVNELKRFKEGEQLWSEYSQRRSTLEETVNDLKQAKESGLSNKTTHSEATGQQDVDSGLISLLSEDEESDSRSSSPTVSFGGTTPTHTVTLTTLELADALMVGHRMHRDFQERQRALRRSPPRRERSRSRSPLRQNESQDNTSRRNRESSPSESTCTSRTSRRPRRPTPFTPSSPSASSTSTNTCGNSDSSVVQSRERSHSRPPVIDDSSSVDSPVGEIRHNISGNEVFEFDGIPEYAVFFSPPGSSEASSYIGDRRVHQWLQRAMESPGSSSSSSNSSSSPSASC